MTNDFSEIKANCACCIAKYLQKNAILDKLNISDRFFNVIQGPEKLGMRQTFPYSMTYSEEVVLHLIYNIQLLKIFRRSLNLNSSFTEINIEIAFP